MESVFPSFAEKASEIKLKKCTEMLQGLSTMPKEIVTREQIDYTVDQFIDLLRISTTFPENNLWVFDMMLTTALINSCSRDHAAPRLELDEEGDPHVVGWDNWTDECQCPECKEARSLHTPAPKES